MKVFRQSFNLKGTILPDIQCFTKLDGKLKIILISESKYSVAYVLYYPYAFNQPDKSKILA